MYNYLYNIYKKKISKHNEMNDKIIYLRSLEDFSYLCRRIKYNMSILDMEYEEMKLYLDVMTEYVNE